jgi:uncharacterized protein
MIDKALTAWRKRYWRADPAALVAFDTLAPFKVITGGSDGIGLALAMEFARLNDNILIIARNPDRLAAAQMQIEQAYALGPKARVATLALDVTSPDAAAHIDKKLIELGAYCDLLVNSAGIGAAGAFTEIEPARLDDLATLNITALTHLCRHYLPGMLIRGRGGILNVASLAGYTPGPYQAAYYASKSYVISLTEALAHESTGQGVRIAVLAPGAVQTKFHTRMKGETGLYLWLMPLATAQSVARSAVLRFRLGQRVIVPGLRNNMLMLCLRVLPHRLTLPIIAILLKPRGGSTNGT